MLPTALETQGKALQINIHRQMLEYEGGTENGNCECLVKFTKAVAVEVKRTGEKGFSFMSM